MSKKINKLEKIEKVFITEIIDAVNSRLNEGWILLEMMKMEYTQLIHKDVLIGQYGHHDHQIKEVVYKRTEFDIQYLFGELKK